MKEVIARVIAHDEYFLCTFDGCYIFYFPVLANDVAALCLKQAVVEIKSFVPARQHVTSLKHDSAHENDIQRLEYVSCGCIVSNTPADVLAVVKWNSII